MTRALLALLIAFAVGSPVGAADPDPALSQALQQAVPRHSLGTWWGSVLVARDGEPLLAAGYGLADDSLRPIDADTLMDIGSVSKQFTAAAILRLETRGVLTTTDRVATFFPELRGDAGENAKAITIHHLLTHTSGLRDETAISPLNFPDRDGAVARALGSRRASAPGEEFDYCNAGYIVLAAIIEQATSKKFEAVVREEVFAPAGMSSTGFLDGEGLDRTRASARNVSRGPRTRRMSLFADEAGEPWAWGLRGAGGVLTTANDLLKWERALAADTVLDAAAKAKLWNVEKDGYALGWFVEFTDRGTRKVHHSGGTRGFTCVLALYPEESAVIAVLTGEQGRPHDIVGLFERALFPGNGPEMVARINPGPLDLNEHRVATFDTGLSLRAARDGERVSIAVSHEGAQVAEVSLTAGRARALAGQVRGLAPRARERGGVGGFLGVRPYNAGQDGRVDLPEGLTLRVLPQYSGSDGQGRVITDDRVTIVLIDEDRGFWPVILKLDRPAASTLADELEAAIGR